MAKGCRILLGPLASFEAVGASMTFNGDFGIDGSRGRNMTFNDSAWAAASLGSAEATIQGSCAAALLKLC